VEVRLATFVIVHGGWGGGWEWAAVADRLRTHGHAVHTPTLTGLGDRAHLARPDLTLATHVQDVVATFESWDVTDAILAGQSYGGVVVTGVVDQIPERVRGLVYIDALVPASGQSCNDLCGEAWTERVRALAREEGDGWLVPLPFKGTLGLSEDVAAWYIPRLVPHPLTTLDEPLIRTGAGDHVPRTYLRCVDESGMEADGDPLASSARTARESGWDYREVVAPHDFHVQDPDSLAAILHQIGG
jgi:pimeloyl-ACP methyl ester carboxylesterase